MAREIELKFDLGPDEVQSIRAHPLLGAEGLIGDAGQRLHAVYFDTDDQALRRAGLSLRIRAEGGRRVQTVKSKGGEDGLLARGEWEAAISADTPDLDLARQTPLHAALQAAEDAQLRPVFETRVERLTRTVSWEDAQVELSLDEGEVVASGTRVVLNQLELELKTGGPSALFSLARALGETVPIRLSFRTKAQAGYDLLDGAGTASVKAEPIALLDNATAAQALQTIGRACLVQLTANQPLLEATRSPQALHQMRIALRRLRAALSTFREIAADARCDQVRAELKWLAGELNAARNLDVFAEETLRPAVERTPDLEGLTELGEEVRAAQSRAYDQALSALASARYRGALLETVAWLETGAWLTGAAGSKREAARDQPVVLFAGAVLDRRRKALKRAGKRLDALDPERRHAVRIDAKKMRYTAEFFSSLFDERKKKRDAFIDALKRVQDGLGELNDIATGPETAAGVLFDGHAPERRTRAIFAAGRIVGARAAKEAQLIETASEAFQTFARAKPFW